MKKLFTICSLLVLVSCAGIKINKENIFSCKNPSIKIQVDERFNFIEKRGSSTFKNPPKHANYIFLTNSKKEGIVITIGKDSKNTWQNRLKAEENFYNEIGAKKGKVSLGGHSLHYALFAIDDKHDKLASKPGKKAKTSKFFSVGMQLYNQYNVYSINEPHGKNIHRFNSNFIMITVSKLLPDLVWEEKSETERDMILNDELEKYLTSLKSEKPPFKIIKLP